MTPEQIKAIRARAGLSANALALTLGLHGGDGSYVRQLERGARNPSGPVIRLLEMLARGEWPARYLLAPVKLGRPKKVD